MLTIVRRALASLTMGNRIMWWWNLLFLGTV